MITEHDCSVFSIERNFIRESLTINGGLRGCVMRLDLDLTCLIYLPG